MATVMATTPIRKTASELSNESPLPTPPRAMHDLIRHGGTRNTKLHAHFDDLDAFTVQPLVGRGGEEEIILSQNQRIQSKDRESSSPSARAAASISSTSQQTSRSLAATMGTASSSSSLVGINTGRASPASLAATIGAPVNIYRSSAGLGSQMGIEDGIVDSNEHLKTSSGRPILMANNRSTSYETNRIKGESESRLSGRSSLRGIRSASLKDKENVDHQHSSSNTRTASSNLRKHQTSTTKTEDVPKLSGRRSVNAQGNTRSPSPTNFDVANNGINEGPSKSTSKAFNRSTYRRSSAEQDDAVKPTASIAANSQADVLRRSSDEGSASSTTAASRRSGVRDPVISLNGNRQNHQSDDAFGESDLVTAHKEGSSAFQTPGLSIGGRALRSAQIGGKPTAAPWSVGRSIKRIDRQNGGLNKPPQRIVATQVRQEEDEEEEEQEDEVQKINGHGNDERMPSPIQEEEDRIEYAQGRQNGITGAIIGSGNKSGKRGSPFEGRVNAGELGNGSDGSGGSGERNAMLQVPLGADEDDEEEDVFNEIQRSVPFSRQTQPQEPAIRRSGRGLGSIGSTGLDQQAHRNRSAMNDILSAKVPSSVGTMAQPRRAVAPMNEINQAGLQKNNGMLNGHVELSRGIAAAPPTPKTISDFMTLVRQEARRQAHVPFLEQLGNKPSKDLETKFNGYKFKKVRKAGEGGFSTVWVVRGPYAAPDPLNPGVYVDVPEEDQAYFAMKQVTLKKMEQVSREEVLEECNLLQTLASKKNNEDFILRFFGWKSSTGSLKILLELGEHDFNQILRAQCLDRTQIVRYWYQMLQAVHFTHEEGNIVHTDLKPANFLMANGRLKLIDFGIAQKIPVGTIHIKREAMIGTPNYMAPETVRAVKEGRNGRSNSLEMNSQPSFPSSRVYKAGKASDVWAMGCILYQMVYNRPPFEAFHGDDKLREILNPNHQIEFSPVRYGPRKADDQAAKEVADDEDDSELEVVDADLIDIMRLTLTYSAVERVTIPQLLQHPLLQPLERQHQRQQARLAAGDGNWLDDDTEGNGNDDITVPMSREMLRDILRKMYAFARSGELNEDNLDARTDALFDNMVLRRQQQSFQHDD